VVGSRMHHRCVRLRLRFGGLPQHVSFAALGPLVARDVLALVLLWAAAGKLRDLRGFVAASRDLLPERLHGAIPCGARLLPALEVSIGVLLLVDPLALAASAATCALLAAFAFVLVRARARGVVTACACFGTRARTPIDILSIVRTGLLLVLGLALVAVELGMASPVGNASASHRVFAGLIAVLLVATGTVVSGAVRLLTTVEAEIRPRARLWSQAA
jgi:hypothetical protein